MSALAAAENWSRYVTGVPAGGDQTALTVAGAGRIRSGDMVVFGEVVAVAPAVVRRDGRVRAAGHLADHARLGVPGQQLDEMAGQREVIGQVAARVVPRGKVKGTELGAMTIPAGIGAVPLMPGADGCAGGGRPVR